MLRNSGPNWESKEATCLSSVLGFMFSFSSEQGDHYLGCSPARAGLRKPKNSYVPRGSHSTGEEGARTLFLSSPNTSG